MILHTFDFGKRAGSHSFLITSDMTFALRKWKMGSSNNLVCGLITDRYVNNSWCYSYMAMVTQRKVKLFATKSLGFANFDAIGAFLQIPKRAAAAL